MERWSGFSHMPPTCGTCDAVGELIDEADAYACVECLEWLDPRCDGPCPLLCDQRDRIMASLLRHPAAHLNPRPRRPYNNGFPRARAKPRDLEPVVAIDVVLGEQRHCPTCDGVTAWLVIGHRGLGCAECVLREMDAMDEETG
jgi:hypothetical protein